MKLSQALSTELRKALNSGSLRKKIPSSILSGLAALKDEGDRALSPRRGRPFSLCPSDDCAARPERPSPSRLVQMPWL